MKQKQNYYSPKIRAIQLCYEQAILQVCILNGLYFENTNRCTTGSTPGTTDPCASSIKGQSQGNFRVVQEISSQGS
ncbi:MAG: hypothetical protein PHQ52_04665 [Candidatus Omnitrophica bacterium]|nr:hypothetical protein [Candidatus Omnitrophota bacterium]